MSRKKLQSFVVGTNQFNENIVLTDENGNNFKTSNSEVFTKVIEASNSTLISKINEVEQQIQMRAIELILSHVVVGALKISGTNDKWE